MPDPTRCSVFDHTCDDCMLPWNWLDYCDDPAYQEAMTILRPGTKW